MDWSPAKSESSLPSPVRSRSRSGSPSPPPPRTITINLFPLTDSIEFAPKHLSFSPDQEIKVGRVSGSRNQKEAKPDNGVFSCDVMSREHALLKEENGKVIANIIEIPISYLLLNIIKKKKKICEFIDSN